MLNRPCIVIGTDILTLQASPDFTLFDVACQLLHKLLSFHPVDDGPPVLPAVAKEGLAVQAEGHTCRTKTPSLVGSDGGPSWDIMGGWEEDTLEKV